MSMQAEFGALTSEAAEWDTTSTALDNAKTKVDGLKLTPDNFSFITFLTGVADDYESARAHVAEILAAGARETGELGDALRGVRDDWNSTDATVRANVRENWIPE